MNAPLPLWKNLLSQNIRTLSELLHYVNISPSVQKQLLFPSQFSMNVPLRLVKKIQKGDFTDPIFRQFVPQQEELKSCPGFLSDPLGELKKQREGRILQKYKGRALLLCSSCCAMHCRFCFRRNFPFSVKKNGWEQEIQWIQKQKDLSEIILSGGDPLSLDNEELGTLFRLLEEVPHIQRIRIHSRFLIGIPERVDEGLLSLFSQRKKTFFLVIHVNHPIELDEDVLTSLQKLQRAGVVLFNQSVLLNGVNDSIAVQKTLLETLINYRILPYYLHQLDPIEGASHFFVTEEKGLQLIEALRNQLPGFGVPRYVKELAGEKGKVPILGE